MIGIVAQWVLVRCALTAGCLTTCGEVAPLAQKGGSLLRQPQGELQLLERAARRKDTCAQGRTRR